MQLPLPVRRYPHPHHAGGAPTDPGATAGPGPADATAEPDGCATAKFDPASPLAAQQLQFDTGKLQLPRVFISQPGPCELLQEIYFYSCIHYRLETFGWTMTAHCRQRGENF